MTNSPSLAFDRLHPKVQRWIWREGWTELRTIQERAIEALLDGNPDVVIASPTASGKTEAAFLPVASRLAELDSAPSVGVLYVSPLKALINDQSERLGPLFESLDMDVRRWHGDVSASHKNKALRSPTAVLLITPESLEALAIRRGSQLAAVFGDLVCVVVDELHAYIGTERGRQLQSLLHRLELVVRRRIARVALSATLGDMDLACDFLRPGQGAEVCQIVDRSIATDVRLQIRGYEIRPPRTSPEEVEVAEAKGELVELADLGTGDEIEISSDLYEKLRGGRHLAFANRRGDVERYTDLLRRICERNRVPSEFWPHHGSLDRALREDAEAALKDGEKPATIVATTTLELGIDVGSVESIAQIGPPSSVTSMRQRLGRSGRRGNPAILRIFVQEPQIDADTPPQDRIREGLVQSVAMVRLLIERWYEPPIAGALHLSTLVQQVLSLIAQTGGFHADEGWRALCGSGPFQGVGPQMFGSLLRDLAMYDLVQQMHEGTLVLGLNGERLVNHFDFYAAFATLEEYRVVHKGATLGSLPTLYPLVPDLLLIFAGRRWKVLEVDEKRKVVIVVPAAGGQPPRFGGSGALVHDRVREEMKVVYESEDWPAYLNPPARALLEEAREEYRELELNGSPILRWGKDCLLFPWVGDRGMSTLALQLRCAGMEVSIEGVALLVPRTPPGRVTDLLRGLAEDGFDDPTDLAAAVLNKQTQKHHRFLSEPLLVEDYASERLDIPAARQAVGRLLKQGG